MVEEQPIGRYRLTERLGTGAFATVWLGYDDELDAPVAIKVLADNWASDADVRARFVAEARLLRRVRDQRVVRVHDIGTLPDGRPYFVMDFADGGTVAEMITDRERLVPEQALRLGAEIARAVQVLHDHGVAHRDIKPGNLLLTSIIEQGGVSGLADPSDPESSRRLQGVVIADLGMAKSLSEASGYTVTAGTPAYMAPEQALGLGFDQRADVYSVAAVTYTLLAGRPPFSGSGLIEIAERSRTSRPPRLGLDHTGAIDAELSAALSFDPNDRPASAGELAARLDLLAGGDAASPGSADRPTVLRRPIGSPTSADPYSLSSFASSPYQTPHAPAYASRSGQPTVIEAAPVRQPEPPVPAARTRAPAPTTTAAVVVGAVALAALTACVTWVLLTLFA